MTEIKKAEAPKMVTYVVSKKKVDEVRESLGRLSGNLKFHQDIQGLIDYLIKE